MTAEHDSNIEATQQEEDLANQKPEVVEQAQEAPDPNDREATKAYLMERYDAAVDSDNVQEIEKLEKEIESFLSNKSPTTLGETKPPAQVPEVAKGATTQPEEPSAKDGASPAAGEDVDKWLKELDPKVRDIVVQRLDQERKAREYHQKKYESDIGRIHAYQRKYEEERKAREALEDKMSATTQPAQTPASSDTRTTAQVASDNAKLKALDEQIKSIRKNGDDELATSLETLRDAFIEEIHARAKATPTQPTIDPEILQFKEEFEKQKFEFHVEKERHRLEQMAPGSLAILDYVDNRGWSPWQEFVSTLPPTLQQAADDANADTYAYLMPLYGQWAERYNAAHGYTTDTQAEAQPNHQTNEANQKATQVQQARQQKLTTSAAAPAKSTPPPAYKAPLEERMKNPPPPGTPEYAQFLEEVDKALSQGKMQF